MTKARAAARRKWPLNILLARPRLLISILVGWDVAVGLYLILAFWMTAHSTVADIHRQYLLQDEGGFAILVLTIVSATASVGAVFEWIEMATRAETFSMHGLALMLLTIALSWAFIHTMFALHYAHEYYAEHHPEGRGLIFPRDHEPDYWDFVYLAFSIGTAASVSDIEICSKRIRRTVLAHGIVSFVFNVTMIALTVGLVGDVVQN